VIVPKPVTRRAVLMNAKTGKPAWHRYIGTYECETPVLPGNAGENWLGGPGWCHIFEAEEPPRVQRVWGVEERTPSPLGGIIPADALFARAPANDSSAPIQVAA
jgi:hypothetical protein